MIRILITALAVWCVVAANAQTAAERIAQGRAYFAQRDFTNANASFSAALALEPNNTTANAFHAATRLLAVTKTDAFHTLLDRAGVNDTNRDVFEWSAEFRTNSAGVPLFAENFNVQETVTFLRGTLLPEVEGAIENLARIQDTAFVLSLTADEAFSTSPVTVDYGDVRLMRAALEFSRYLLYTVGGLNFDAQAEAIRSLHEADALNVEQVLRRFPQLLTISSTNDLAPAKDAFQKSISNYMAASALIRGRPTNVVRLFNLDESEAEAEASFRVTLGELERSLDSVIGLTEFPDVTVHAGKLFSAPKSWREMLPEFAKSDVISGTLPDVTFGGVIFGVERYQIEAELSGVGVDVAPRLIPARAVSGNIQVSVNAVNGEPLFVLRSTDLKGWSFYGYILPTNGVVTFNEPIPSSGGNSYFMVSDRVPPPVIVAPLDEASLTAQNKIYTVSIAGQAEPVTFSFPAAGNYLMIQGGVTETGTVSGATRDNNYWVFNITPDAGQEGALAGILYLGFVESDAGTWTFNPFGGQLETGTFTVSLPGGGGTTGGPDVTTLTGRTLQMTYPNGGERFYFFTDTQVSYENGAETGTYTWDSTTRQLSVSLTNGWFFEINLPLGGDSASVTFKLGAGASPETTPANYTLK